MLNFNNIANNLQPINNLIFSSETRTTRLPYSGPETNLTMDQRTMFAPSSHNNIAKIAIKSLLSTRNISSQR